MGAEFILHSDHKALKFIQAQHKFNPYNSKWVEYLHAFHFMIYYKTNKLNKDANDLPRRYLLLSVLESMVLALELVKEMYANNEDFKEVYVNSSNHAHGLFHLQEGF